MPSSLITLLIVAFVCLVLGVLAGYLFAGTGEEPVDETPPPEAPPGGKKGKYTPVVRLWREKTSQTLIVEMDGKAYVAPEPLSAEQRERLERSSRDLARWVGNAPLSEPARLPPSPQPQEPPPPRIASTAPAQSPLKEPPPVPPVISRPVESAFQPNSVPPDPAARRASPPRVEIKTVVQQIDEVVKERALGTKFEQFDISLSEDLRKGVIVWIGSSRYDGIDGVPDPEIQAFIRSAVAEWERRQDQRRPG